MIKNINLEKGKQIFFNYYGDGFSIMRELGDEYRKCHIPPESEQKWREEIKDDLLFKIKHTTGEERMGWIIRYTQILENTESINFLIKMLHVPDMDTFSSIMLAESMKRLSKRNPDENLQNTVNMEIKHFKEKTENEKITVDESYKKVYYMKDYDFSDVALLNRIASI